MIKLFLFSLSLLELYPIKKGEYAFWYVPSNFFSFGKADLTIALNFLEKNANTSLFPGSFSNYLSYDRVRITNNKEQFTIVSLETYQISFES